MESPAGRENAHMDVIHREMAECEYPTEILDAARGNVRIIYTE